MAVLGGGRQCRFHCVYGISVSVPQHADGIGHDHVVAYEQESHQLPQLPEGWHQPLLEGPHHQHQIVLDSPAHPDGVLNTHIRIGQGHEEWVQHHRERVLQLLLILYFAYYSQIGLLK